MFQDQTQNAGLIERFQSRATREVLGAESNGQVERSVLEPLTASFWSHSTIEYRRPPGGEMDQLTIYATFKSKQNKQIWG